MEFKFRKKGISGVTGCQLSGPGTSFVSPAPNESYFILLGQAISAVKYCEIQEGNKICLYFIYFSSKELQSNAPNTIRESPVAFTALYLQAGFIASYGFLHTSTLPLYLLKHAYFFLCTYVSNFWYFLFFLSISFWIPTWMFSIGHAVPFSPKLDSGF